MSNPIPSYDGSRPEPPYNTDTDAVALLQEDLDAMTADRDRLQAERDALAKDLGRVRRNLTIRMMNEAADSANRMMWIDCVPEAKLWFRRRAGILSRFAGRCRAALAKGEA